MHEFVLPGTRTDSDGGTTSNPFDQLNFGVCKVFTEESESRSFLLDHLPDVLVSRPMADNLCRHNQSEVEIQLRSTEEYVLIQLLSLVSQAEVHSRDNEDSWLVKIKRSSSLSQSQLVVLQATVYTHSSISATTHLSFSLFLAFSFLTLTSL